MFLVLGLILSYYTIKELIKLAIFYFSINKGFFAILELVLIVLTILATKISPKVLRGVISAILWIILAINTFYLLFLRKNATLPFVLTLIFCWLYYKAGDIESKLIRKLVRIPLFLMIFRMSGYLLVAFLEWLQISLLNQASAV